jgi:hypothetical protein
MRELGAVARNLFCHAWGVRAPGAIVSQDRGC